MTDNNKAILEKANAAIAKGDLDGFLAFCSDDTEWTYVGDITLTGKEAVRRYLETTNSEPPNFTVTNLIAEGDFLTALGDIIMKDKDGQPVRYAYCDVWRLRDGKLAELKAFVIKTNADD
ncbi:hypothetical protein FAES_3406 [Fibrella aestuarina BUZ 2]|uniref:SnoaL-like domain-containing protein n=1 Tax=Fibrella aestuarina BUZ 2 TaxID=1166018 RepID=I0KBB1_9BACT|nr:nuclear transport factor 2 family protein [Fibrella aestuarina]CCH01414.1 hypothetical protein FAES_3406 [Fibrella aestuarina BUZ 2]